MSKMYKVSGCGSHILGQPEGLTVARAATGPSAPRQRPRGLGGHCLLPALWAALPLSCAWNSALCLALPRLLLESCPKHAGSGPGQPRAALQTPQRVTAAGSPSARCTPARCSPTSHMESAPVQPTQAPHSLPQPSIPSPAAQGPAAFFGSKHPAVLLCVFHSVKLNSKQNSSSSSSAARPLPRQKHACLPGIRLVWSHTDHLVSEHTQVLIAEIQMPYSILC